MTKHPVIQTEHYVVYVEPVQAYWFIHMDVFKWTKTIRQQFLSDWNDWTEQHKDKVLLAMPFIDDMKMEKWTAMTGFKLIGLLQGPFLATSHDSRMFNQP